MKNTSNSARGRRLIPESFGVIDAKFVMEGYLKRLSSDATALYVFLCVVANKEGKSWYSDGRIIHLVRLHNFASARLQLIEEGLIEWERPVYTLLSVGHMKEKVKIVPTAAKIIHADKEHPARPEEVAIQLNSFRRTHGWT